MSISNHRLGALTLTALIFAGCAGGAESEKRMLAKHGTIDAEWEVRNDAEKKALTYMMLRTSSGVHELYEVTVMDGKSAAAREQVGGIDGTGCFLLPAGLSSAWILGKGAEVLEGTTQSGDKTRTRCLEYKDTGAWMFIPEKDRKAAEPPPPPPPAPPTSGPDAGSAPEADAGNGAVKSALP